MTRISQLIAVVGGIKAETESRFTQLQHVVGNAALFSGHERTYQPRADDGVQLPPESLKVRVTGSEVLDITQQLLTREWDVVRTLDEANASAYGDVKVDGTVLLEHVVVGHLLWLDRELKALAALTEALPALDQSRTWVSDSHGQSMTEPVETTKTEKTPYSFTLAEATEHHPAQVQLMNRDEVVGYWRTVTLSGAVSQDRKKELAYRIGQLRDAVKMAREEANSMQVEDKAEGKAVFEWLLRP